MAIFIFQGRYTKEAMRGMVDNPEDRSIATGKMVEAAGGRLISYYVTLGEWDFIVTADLPDQATAAAVAMAVAAAGGIDSHIIAAMTTAEAKAAMERAKDLRAAFATPGKVTH